VEHQPHIPVPKKGAAVRRTSLKSVEGGDSHQTHDYGHATPTTNAVPLPSYEATVSSSPRSFGTSLSALDPSPPASYKTAPPPFLSKSSPDDAIRTSFRNIYPPADGQDTVGFNPSAESSPHNSLRSPSIRLNGDSLTEKDKESGSNSRPLSRLLYWSPSH
jgi:hypothetical protein